MEGPAYGPQHLSLPPVAMQRSPTLVPQIPLSKVIPSDTHVLSDFEVRQRAKMSLGAISAPMYPASFEHTSSSGYPPPRFATKPPQPPTSQPPPSHLGWYSPGGTGAAVLTTSPWTSPRPSPRPSTSPRPSISPRPSSSPRLSTGHMVESPRPSPASSLPPSASGLYGASYALSILILNTWTWPCTPRSPKC